MMISNYFCTRIHETQLTGCWNPYSTGGCGFFLAWEDLGRLTTIYSSPVLFFFSLSFFWRRDYLIHTNCTRPGSVHSYLVSWDDCGRVFPDELHVSLFPDHLHLSLNCWGHWGTTITYSLTMGVIGAPQITSQPISPFFSVLHGLLGLGELQAYAFPDLVFPPLFLSTLSSSPLHCSWQDGFWHSWGIGDMSIPLQFASLYDGQELFVWSDFLLSLGTDFLFGNLVFVWDA